MSRFPAKFEYVYFSIAIYTYAYIMHAMNALKNIRVNVFGVTQSEMARLVNVTQATVSRWEKGVPPSLDDMRAIRDAARAQKLDWSDALFFDDSKEAAE